MRLHMMLMVSSTGTLVNRLSTSIDARIPDGEAPRTMSRNSSEDFKL